MPPRTLAKEYFLPPAMAANAAWSRRIARGPTIRPLALPGLGAGRCNGFAPEDWYVAGHAPDDSMFHVMAPAPASSMRSIKSAGPERASVRRILCWPDPAQIFERRLRPRPPQARAFRFCAVQFRQPEGRGGLCRISRHRQPHRGVDRGRRPPPMPPGPSRRPARWLFHALRCAGRAARRCRAIPPLATTSVSTRCHPGRMRRGRFRRRNI